MPQRQNVNEQTLLARRVEEASLNAWPALNQIFLDGWILRFSKGFTKRSNSIVPLYPPLQGYDLDRPASLNTLIEKIRYSENLYAREQLQTVFRLTSIEEQFPGGARVDRHGLDDVLNARGYRLEDTSHVMGVTLDHDHASNPDTVEWLALDQWLTVYSALTGLPEPARAIHGVILNGIAGDCGFAVVKHQQRPVACGLGVVEKELVGLFDLYTAPSCRGQGFGSALIKGLLNWAYDKGARLGYLQVAQDNTEAIRLYQRLGFEEIYHYWYRISP